MKIKKRAVMSSLALSCLFAIFIGIIIKHKTSTTIKTPLVVESEKNEFFNKQVIEDIDFALNTIKKYHISCIKEVPQEVLQQKDIEIANLQETTSTIEVWKILSRILKKLHDAHSVAYHPKFLDCKQLPFQTRNVGNKIFCDSGRFKDAEIIEVDGIKISDLYENFKQHWSYEIEEWPHANFFERNYLQADILALSGVDVTKPIEVTLNTDKGTVKKQFRIFRKKHITAPPVSYVIDKENDLGIFKMDECKTYYARLTVSLPMLQEIT